MSVNLAQDIERLANGERIEGLALGFDGGPIRLMGWSAARPLLDWEYDAGGWDGPPAPNLMAWTQSWVLFAHDYDTSTSISRVPRNPTDKIGTGMVGAS